MSVTRNRRDLELSGLTRTGALDSARQRRPRDAPTFLAPDRTGRYLLSAYYQGGYAAVHPLGPDGAVGAPLLDRHETAIGAHAIATDPSNRFAFVPHISRVQDNVLEPPKNIPGPNFIAQFRFDAETGRLTPNAPFRVEQAELVGPRHYCFHPDRDLVYFSDEQGCSVSVYRLDAASGALSRCRRVGTLPDGYSGRNTCSQIHLTPSAKFLYVGNRGHNSIAGFAVDGATGRLERGRPCSDRSGPERVRPRSRREFSVRRRHRDRQARLLPHRRRDRHSCPARHLRRRKAPGGGAGGQPAQLGRHLNPPAFDRIA